MVRMFIYHTYPSRLQFLQKTATFYFQQQKHTYCLTATSKYDDALEYLSRDGKKDDIFFIDFWDFPSGIRMASCLREQNPRGLWAYLDGPAENLYKAMLLQPCAYIPDSGDHRLVLDTLQRIGQYQQMLQKSYYFSFKCEGEYLRVPFDEISYFESRAKKVTLSLARGEKRYCFAAKLDDLAKEFPSCFLRCHKSYLVNMNMIKCLDTKNHVFILHSNEEILISRRSYQETKERYQNFLENHG